MLTATCAMRIRSGLAHVKRADDATAAFTKYMRINHFALDVGMTEQHLLKPVIQLEPTSCGIASVAAIVGVSYSRARAVAHSFGIFADDQNLWSETAHVRKLLRHFGLRVDPAEIAFHSWEALPDPALLSIKWHLENGRPFLALGGVRPAERPAPCPRLKKRSVATGQNRLWPHKAEVVTPRRSHLTIRRKGMTL